MTKSGSTICLSNSKASKGKVDKTELLRLMRDHSEAYLAREVLPYALANTENGHVRVLIRGREYPYAGTVTMDQIVVDLGDDPVEVGDEVVVMGIQGPAAARSIPATTNCPSARARI